MDRLVGFSFYLITVLFCLAAVLAVIFDLAVRLWVKEDYPQKLFFLFLGCGYLFGLIFYFLKFLNLTGQNKTLVYAWTAFLALVFIVIGVKLIASLNLIRSVLGVLTGAVFSGAFLALVLFILKAVNEPYYTRFTGDFLIFFK